MHEDNDVPNRHVKLWKRAWWIRGRREAVDERGVQPREPCRSGEQPEEQPNRLAMTIGSKRPQS